MVIVKDWTQFKIELPIMRIKEVTKDENGGADKFICFGFTKGGAYQEANFTRDQVEIPPSKKIVYTNKVKINDSNR